MKSIVQIILAGAAIAAILLAGPFILIWALNTLFPVLAIPFNLSTWFAVIVLSSSFGAVSKASK